MERTEYPWIVYPFELDERAIFEMPLKGWVRARVETAPGEWYELHFYDPVRLAQELHDIVEAGDPCFTERGLVVLPEVTPENVERAVQYLSQTQFFLHLRSDEQFKP
jgi:hypothetical protein